MLHCGVEISFQKANIVGSFGSLDDLCSAKVDELAYCDVLEIRLDILRKSGWQLGEKPWAHLRNYPLLFTARIKDEGGVLEWCDAERKAALRDVIDDAAAVDIEIFSAENFTDVIETLHNKKIPWIASHHNFSSVPSHDLLEKLLLQATEKGAHVFKVAAQVNEQADIEKMISFQKEKSLIKLSTMGMGMLAESSRIQCAAAGSVLNYGYIGTTKTAPGQCTAAALAEKIHH